MGRRKKETTVFTAFMFDQGEFIGLKTPIWGRQHDLRGLGTAKGETVEEAFNNVLQKANDLIREDEPNNIRSREDFEIFEHEGHHLISGRFDSPFGAIVWGLIIKDPE